MSIRATSVGFLAGCATAAIAALIAWGPLNPPAGPVAGTAKPLGEIEPRIAINATNTPGDADSVYKITQAGSYYLTGNLNGVAGKHGIEITVSDVTVDLMGFRVQGVAGSLSGIATTTGGVRNPTLCNGSLEFWGGSGIDLTSAPAVNATISRIHANSNGVDGIRASQLCIVTECTARLNGGGGISVDIAGHISNCLSTSNTGSGFVLGDSSAIAHCVARANGGDGFSGVTYATLRDCQALNNTANGFNVGNGSAFTTCTASNNLGSGIIAPSRCRVTGCAVNANTGDGIAVTDGCLVANNACTNNGAGVGNAAAIHVTGTDNHLDSNVCTGADRGIDVGAAGNFIARNTCSGNTTNWSIAVAGNVILVVNAATALAFSGNSGGTPPGSTDPNANFSY